MDDQVPMRVRNRLTDCEKQLQDVTQIELAARPVDGDTVDELHNEVWLAIGSVASVKKTGDTAIIP